jgi:prevent-host-death family protein
MKEISIRELHRNTGKWVRSARKYGAIVVSDRNVPVARLIPVDANSDENPFRSWKPLKHLAELLETPVGGTPVEQIISEDRDR